MSKVHIGASEVVIQSGPRFDQRHADVQIVEQPSPPWRPESVVARANAERRRALILELLGIIDRNMDKLDQAHDIVWIARVRKAITTTEC